MNGGAPVQGGGPEHGYDQLRRLRRQALSALRARIERRSCTACCGGFFAGLAGGALMLTLAGYLISLLLPPATQAYHSIESVVIVVGMFVLAIIAAFLGVRTSRAKERSLIRREMDYLMRHFQRVLFDQGLLAIVLAEDPFSEVPGLGRIAGIPGTESIGRRGGSGSVRLEQRLQVLFEHYGLICRHYRIEAYPPAYEYGVFPVRLRDAPLHACMLTLAVGILGEDSGLSAIVGH